MSGASGFGLLLFAAALLVFHQAPDTLAGLPRQEAAVLLALASLVFLLTGWLIDQFRIRFTAGLSALVLWGVAVGGLIGAYAYRGEIGEAAGRFLGEVGPEPTATVGPGGEVTVPRRSDGSFVVPARANDRDLRFVFDTGATSVVLTAESAAAIGIDLSSLIYVVPVFTANGRNLAAPVTLDRLAVGAITERRVRALVAKPGMLRENLLGMTFLERLPSYEVRGNNLILRGRGQEPG